MNGMLGVVVVTYNRRDLLLECLRANLGQEDAPDLVFVVDNASTDGTPEALQLAGHLANTRIRYHRLKTNLGGAGGFHFGMQKAFEAGCDWVWIMDDDAIPEPDALKQLLQHIPESSNPPVLASQVVKASGQTDTGHRCRMELSLLRYTHYSNNDYKKEAFEADMATFVGPLIHRRHFETCGLPRTDYFIYYDDFEYTYRLRRAGFPVVVVPRSRVNHLDASHIGAAAMRGQAWEWRMYYKARNRVHWYRGLVPGRFRLGFRLALIFLDMFYEILRYAPEKRNRIKLLLRAFSDGWHGRLGKTIDPAAYGK